MTALEYELFVEIREQAASEIPRIQQIAETVARNRRICVSWQRWPQYTDMSVPISMRARSLR